MISKAKKKLYDSKYTKDHRKERSAYKYKWTQKNKKRLLPLKRTYDKKHRLYLKLTTPWIFNYKSAKSRCTNTNNKDFCRYGGRGIKFLMTKADFKYLWFRDKAWLMDRPSIDRINNNRHYELTNCRMIEFTENTIRRHYVA